MLTLRITLVAIAVLFPATVHARPSRGLPANILAEAPAPDAFPLVTLEAVAPLWYDVGYHAGVLRTIRDLEVNVERVTTRLPVVSSMRPEAANIVIVGTLEIVEAARCLSMASVARLGLKPHVDNQRLG